MAFGKLKGPSRSDGPPKVFMEVGSVRNPRQVVFATKVCPSGQSSCLFRHLSPISSLTLKHLLSVVAVRLTVAVDFESVNILCVIGGKPLVRGSKIFVDRLGRSGQKQPQEAAMASRLIEDQCFLLSSS